MRVRKWGALVERINEGKWSVFIGERPKKKGVKKWWQKQTMGGSQFLG